MDMPLTGLTITVVNGSGMADGIRIARQDFGIVQKGKWGGTDPHDHVDISSGRVVRLTGDLLHYAYFTVDEHLIQMHRFGEIAARAKYRKGEKPVFFIHVILNPLFKFVKKYFLQLGFLDGYYGFVFCAAVHRLIFSNTCGYTNTTGEDFRKTNSQNRCNEDIGHNQHLQFS